MHLLVAAAVLNAAFFAGVGKQALDSGAPPGIAIAVVYQGRTVYEEGFGLADLATRAPVTATVAPGDDPAVDARVRAFWNQLASGDVDRNALTTDFAALLTPDYLSQVRAGIELLGELRSFTFVGTRQAQNATIYRYVLGFAGGVEHEWDVAITSAGKIAGSRLVR
ncbi:MAG: hypothetical protein WA431_08270 [Candidatus Cybelea sp.]